MTNMNKRILIAVGGTAGHVYPAMAFASDLKKKHPSTYVYFAGGGLQNNRYFERQSYPFEEVSCGYFPFRQPMRCLASAGRTFMGILQSILIIGRVKPDVVVGFGSYHSFPVIMAARILRIPYILHEANSVPGKVNRYLSNSAVVTGVQFPNSARFLKGKTLHVEMPLRAAKEKRVVSPEAAFSRYQLLPDRFTLLVFGGSQGAVALNTIVPDMFLCYAAGTKGLQVIHFTGEGERVASVQQRYRDAGVLATVRSYEQEMDYAWSIADLVISRAGAGTISEQIEYEVPGILVPFPFATDNHQEKNADFMVETVGGAIKVKESDATPSQMGTCLVQMLAENRRRLVEMKESIQKYKQQTQVPNLCTVLQEALSRIEE